jgi:hypothetical protein
MSNFTDFFSAGGGGTGRTVTVGDITYVNARTASELKMMKVSKHGDNSSYRFNDSFGHTSHPEHYFATSSSSTWTTVVNITSSSNGGGAYMIMTGLHNTTQDHNNRQEQIKITVDGTATTYTAYALSEQGNTRAWLNGLSPIFAQQEGGSNGVGNTFNYNMTPCYGEGQIDNYSYDASTNSYYKARDNSTAHRLFTYLHEDQQPHGVPFLYFQSTFKFEMNFGRNNNEDYGRAFVKLF